MVQCLGHRGCQVVRFKVDGFKGLGLEAAVGHGKRGLCMANS